MEQGRHKKVSYKSKKTVWLPEKGLDRCAGHARRASSIPDSFARVQQMLREHARGGGQGTVNPLARKGGSAGYCGSRNGADRFGLRQQKCGKGFEPLLSAAAPPRGIRTRCPGQDYMPMEQLQELVLERVRHHIAGYLKPEKPEARNRYHSRRRNRCRAKRNVSWNGCKAEILRRRKAMQELYLDKSSGTVSSAQFAQIEPVLFCTKRIALRKAMRAKLEDALARSWRTRHGQRKNAGAICFSACRGK